MNFQLSGLSICLVHQRSTHERGSKHWQTASYKFRAVNSNIIGLSNESACREEYDKCSPTIPLTHYIEAAIEFADSISSPTLSHLADLCPLVEMRIKPFHTGQWRHAVVASHSIHKILKMGEHKVVKCWVHIADQIDVFDLSLQFYPQCHGSNSSPGGVHRRHGTPAVTFNVITLHVVETGVVVQTSNSIYRTTKGCQGYPPPEIHMFMKLAIQLMLHRKKRTFFTMEQDQNL